MVVDIKEVVGVMAVGVVMMVVEDIKEVKVVGVEVFVILVG